MKTLKLFLLIIGFISVSIPTCKVTVIGAGYVGLVMTAGLASMGHEVVCADIDKKRIDCLQNKEVPLYEQGLEELLNEYGNSIIFTTDVARAIQSSRMVVIAVGTPMGEDGIADLSAVTAVAALIGKNLNNYKIVCIKSTVPVGTAYLLKSYIDAPSNKYDIVSNPEFLREGTAISDFLHPSRIVLGVASERALECMKELYAPLLDNNTPLLVTNSVSAEMIKYGSNSYLALRLSYINEIANLCDAVGADVKDVSYGMGLDPRIGTSYFKPGPGFGGSCFDKDCSALLKTSQMNGCPMYSVDIALKINEQQKRIAVKKVKHFLSDLDGKTIAVLGLSFKADTDDIRFSPSIAVIDQLIQEGAQVKAYDPMANGAMQGIFPDIYYGSTKEEVMRDADAVIIMTDWDEFKLIDWKRMKAFLAFPIVIDTRNILNAYIMCDLGYQYASIGRDVLCKFTSNRSFNSYH